MLDNYFVKYLGKSEISECYLSNELPLKCDISLSLNINKLKKQKLFLNNKFKYPKDNN